MWPLHFVLDIYKYAHITEKAPPSPQPYVK